MAEHLGVLLQYGFEEKFIRRELAFLGLADVFAESVLHVGKDDSVLEGAVSAKLSEHPEVLSTRPPERAPETFDLLKKAELELGDKAKREELNAVTNQAQKVILKSLDSPIATPPSDSKLQGLSPSFKVRAVKLNSANEGSEVASKKRKAAEEQACETNRDQE
ncbi:hypothetical protein EST38_g3033 [Candolleomyces aberdarensis]|uniref:Uncharacterized protein n=1 Tax=Candolleomyces aberdarensis TaxID=2316362 RepID=A0A4Q2DRK9_9AGAR|nr:hypothetical protein EST38_g3033 [Candolleomyces aberdarensis]